MSDQAGIERTIVRYAWGYDSLDIDAVVDCFTEDAVIEVSVEGVEPARGHDGIRAFIGGARGRRAELGQQPRHLVTNIDIVDLDESEATARTYMTLVITHPDGRSEIDCAGTYDDRLVAVDGEWKLSSRRINFDRDLKLAPAAGRADGA